MRPRTSRWPTSPGRPRRQLTLLRRQWRQLRPRATGAPETIEAARWRLLEEQDDGRIAQEADHLFDTSYVWAA